MRDEGMRRTSGPQAFQGSVLGLGFWVMRVCGVWTLTLPKLKSSSSKRGLSENSPSEERKPSRHRRDRCPASPRGRQAPPGCRHPHLDGLGDRAATNRKRESRRKPTWRRTWERNGSGMARTLGGGEWKCPPPRRSATSSCLQSDATLI